jgi:hypothetical protein
MPEQTGSAQRPELDPRIIAYFERRGLDTNDIPQKTCEKLLYWPDNEIDVLVKVLDQIGIALENDAPRDEGDSLESGGKPTTPLKKYQFVVH